LAANNLEELRMATRPAGRPKATSPRDVRVTVRFTEMEIDQVYRVKGHNESLADCIRRYTMNYLWQLTGGPGGQKRPDNEEARIQRARRAARRAEASPRPDLEHTIGRALHDADEELA